MKTFTVNQLIHELMVLRDLEGAGEVEVVTARDMQSGGSHSIGGIKLTADRTEVRLTKVELDK